MATYWENSCSFGLRYVSWYKYLIVSLVFSHLGFWSGNLFLIAPFPDLCLLVPFWHTHKQNLVCVTCDCKTDQLGSNLRRSVHCLGDGCCQSDIAFFNYSILSRVV